MVVDQKSHRSRLVGQLPNQLASLLRDPQSIGVGYTTCQMEASGAEFNKEQHINGLEQDGIHREKITSEDLALVMPQEAAPGTRRSLQGVCDPVPLQDIPD